MIFPLCFSLLLQPSSGIKAEVRYSATDGLKRPKEGGPNRLFLFAMEYPETKAKGNPF